MKNEKNDNGGGGDFFINQLQFPDDSASSAS